MAKLGRGSHGKADSGLTYDDVLRYLSITVASADAPTVPLAGSAAANQIGESAAVLLGTVRPGEAPLELTVTITVDPAMGNDFQQAAAHIVSPSSSIICARSVSSMPRSPGTRA